MLVLSILLNLFLFHKTVQLSKKINLLSEKLKSVTEEYEFFTKLALEQEESYNKEVQETQQAILYSEEFVEAYKAYYNNWEIGEA